MGSYDIIKIYHFSGFEIKQLQIEIKMNLKSLKVSRSGIKKLKHILGFSSGFLRDVTLIESLGELYLLFAWPPLTQV